MIDRFNSDIDIDVANRDKLLSVIDHIPASMVKNGKYSKHNSGIYVTDIPIHPIKSMSSIEYNAAEERGYIKLDILNMSIYEKVKSETHLVQLMNTEPKWNNLYDRKFCERLIHIGNHYDTLLKCPEPVNSIPRLAMFLSIIRPGKRHLIGKPWAEVAKTVWEKDDHTGYTFKKSHSISYSTLVVVNMNLIEEGLA
jgi:hypothetical protein